MKVIGGIAKGHKLFSPDNFLIRPTIGRIKESIFNIIYKEIVNSNFLDLYSGTGAIGIEALSRGAKKCTFVDNNIEIIGKNLDYVKKALLNCQKKVLKLNVFQAIDKLYEENEKFDIIFMDPPYNKNLNNKTLNKIYKKNILNKNGIIILEQNKNDIKLNIKDKFKISKEKCYASTSILFLNFMED